MEVRKAPLVAQMVKNLPAMQEKQVRSLGQKDPLEKEMATHSSTLARRTPWTEEPRGLQSWTRLSGGSRLCSHPAGIRPLAHLPLGSTAVIHFAAFSKLLGEPSVTALLKLVAKSISHPFSLNTFDCHT